MLKAMIEMGKMITRSTAKETAEYMEFLDFYEALVRNISSEGARAFGNMSVDMRDGKGAGIELSPADFGYWNEAIRSGRRFKSSITDVKLNMYDRLTKCTNAQHLSADDRAALVDLIKGRE